MHQDLKDLKRRIKKRIPQLTTSQKVIANYIVENPQKFALSSVRELEKELKTSKSTIVRLAQALNYEGFHELKRAFLKSIRHNIDPMIRYKSFLSDPKDNSDIIDLIAEETKNNIHDTLVLVDKDQFSKAVQLIENANCVHTVGMGISKYLAEISTYFFNRITIKSNPLSFGAISFPEQVINFDVNDILLAFSFPPYSKETTEAARYANDKAIKVLCITDKVTNEIVQYCDVVLQVAVDSMTFSNSIMPVLVIIYSMVAQVGQDTKKRTLERIDAVAELRKKYQI